MSESKILHLPLLLLLIISS